MTALSHRAASRSLEGQVSALRPRLLRTARSFTRNQADAEDLVHATVARALEKRARFRAGSDLLSWMRTLMKNLAIDNARRSSHSLLGLEIALGAWDEPPRREKWWEQLSIEHIREALPLLPPRLRDPFRLHYFEGTPVAQLASRLGVKVSTVGTRLFRARSRLRTLLAGPERSEGNPAITTVDS